MKKILLFLLLVFPIVAKAQLELPFSIKLVNSAPIDFWYYESDGTPYDNTGEVISQVLSAIRYRGMTFNVNGVEYWFGAGIADVDLVIKSGSGGGGTWGSITGTLSAQTDLYDGFIKTQGTSILTDDIIVDADTMDISIYSDGGFGFNSTYQPDGIHEWGLGFNQQLYSYPQAGPGTEMLRIMSYRIGIFDAGGADYAIDIRPSPATWRNKIPSGYTYSIVGSGDENMFSVDSFLGNIDIGNSGTTLTLPNIPAASGQTYAVVVDDTGLVSSQAIGGGGDVTKVGTPADNQIGVWTGDGTIEGTSGLTYNGSNLQLTGDIGSTGTRITKGWFTDLQVTNAIAGSITGNAATVTTNANLTGDVTSVGNATAIASGVIVNADVNASAAIGATKLIDGSITDTELGYINTLSSNAQTQITAREVLTNKATDLSTFNSTLYPTTASLFARRDVTGTDAIVQADNGKTIYFNSGSPFNFTIDALTTNSSIYFYNKGSATVTFVDGSGVTSTGVTSLAAGESGGIIYESSTTPIILGAPSGGGSGDVVGPSSSVAGTLALFDGTTGKLLKEAVSATNRVTSDGGQILFEKVSSVTGNNLIRASNGGAGENHAMGLLLLGGNASGSNYDGGDVIIQSGIPNGSGAKGAVQIADSADKLGFFEVTPVIKQSAPTTAQGIADVLTAYGLIPSSTISGGGGSGLTYSQVKAMKFK